jgi:nicotinate-nucleotide pyrophosphorylase (carboxylating)
VCWTGKSGLPDLGFSVSLPAMDALHGNLRDCVLRALAEDLGGVADVARDLTSSLSVPETTRGRAWIRAKASGVLAGTEAATCAFEMLEPTACCEVLLQDGSQLAPGDVVLEVHGTMRALLAAERTALNFLQRLSGVATLTRAFVRAVEGTAAGIYDTRKTTPGLRELEKRAVLAGGGCNHRIGLFDQVLLKENHFASARRPHEEVVRDCVVGQGAPVVAEARTIDEALAVVRGGASVVLLDNFDAGAPLREAVATVRALAAELGRTDVQVEASGGITIDNVRAYAECGVDRISVGALTHSAPAMDLSLLVEGAG